MVNLRIQPSLSFLFNLVPRTLFPGFGGGAPRHLGVSPLYSRASYIRVVAHEWEARSNPVQRGRVTVVQRKKNKGKLKHSLGKRLWCMVNRLRNRPFSIVV